MEALKRQQYVADIKKKKEIPTPRLFAEGGNHRLNREDYAGCHRLLVPTEYM